MVRQFVFIALVTTFLILSCASDHSTGNRWKEARLRFMQRAAKAAAAAAGSSSSSSGEKNTVSNNKAAANTNGSVPRSSSVSSYDVILLPNGNLEYVQSYEPSQCEQYTGTLRKICVLMDRLKNSTPSSNTLQENLKSLENEFQDFKMSWDHKDSSFKYIIKRFQDNWNDEVHWVTTLWKDAKTKVCKIEMELKRLSKTVDDLKIKIQDSEDDSYESKTPIIDDVHILKFLNAQEKLFETELRLSEAAQIEKTLSGKVRDAIQTQTILNENILKVNNFDTTFSVPRGENNFISSPLENLRSNFSAMHIDKLQQQICTMAKMHEKKVNELQIKITAAENIELELKKQLNVAKFNVTALNYEILKIKEGFNKNYGDSYNFGIENLENELKTAESKHKIAEDDLKTLQGKFEHAKFRITSLQTQYEADIKRIKEQLFEVERKNVQLELENERIDEELKKQFLVVDEKDKELSQLETALKECELKITDKEEEIKQKIYDIEQKEIELEDKEEELRMKDDLINQKNDEIELKDEELQQKEELLDERKNDLQLKENESDMLDYQLKQLEAEIQGKEDELKLKDDLLIESNSEVLEKDKEIQKKEKLLSKKSDELKQRDILLEQRSNELKQRYILLKQKDVEIQKKVEEVKHRDDKLHEKINELLMRTFELQQCNVSLQQQNISLDQCNTDLSYANSRVLELEKKLNIMENGTNPYTLPFATLNGTEFYFSSDALTRHEASKFCRTLGMELVSLETEEKNNLIIQHIIRSGWAAEFFWTSGMKVDGDWTWNYDDDDAFEDFSYTRWYAGQPDGVGDKQDCVQSYTHSRHFCWFDYVCSSPEKFICEKLTMEEF